MDDSDRGASEEPRRPRARRSHPLDVEQLDEAERRLRALEEQLAEIDEELERLKRLQ